jgi:hypothetical protein
MAISTVQASAGTRYLSSTASMSGGSGPVWPGSAPLLADAGLALGLEERVTAAPLEAGGDQAERRRFQIGRQGFRTGHRRPARQHVAGLVGHHHRGGPPRADGAVAIETEQPAGQRIDQEVAAGGERLP